jgi:hypothetical protein
MSLDDTVKLAVYGRLAETGKAPTAQEVAAALALKPDEVAGAFARLHQRRLLVPEPGDPSRIRMAPPFSGIATPFEVRSDGVLYHANCIWDALGIPAALHRDAVIDARDGHTGEPMALEVLGGRPVSRPCVIHFAVPAARWWTDIVYT